MFGHVVATQLHTNKLVKTGYMYMYYMYKRLLCLYQLLWVI
jgi:hypothetical protein